MSHVTNLPPAVDDYLRRLDLALRDLPRERRDEIAGEIREHITEALAAAGPTPTEAGVRNVLEKVGEPEDIADEARRRFGVPKAGPLTWRDWSVPVLLPFGTFLFFVGWFVGVAFLWSSTAFRRWEKVLATAVWPLGMATPFYAGGWASAVGGSATTCVDAGNGVETCSVDVVGTTTFGLTPSGVIVTILMCAPIVVAAYLTVRLIRVNRAAAPGGASRLSTG